MVAVNMGHEHRFDTSDIVTGPPKTGKGCGGSVDDVAPVEEREGMVPAMWEEGVARPQHFDTVHHVARTARCFFFSSVRGFGSEDVKRYQR